MAKLHVLGSSSQGNGYVIQLSSGESLILEAGLPFRDALRATGFQGSKISGLCYSHEHSDHAKYASTYKMRKVCPDSGVAPMKWYAVGSFKVLPFDVQHDVPCFGYIIKHPEFGSILFATDCMNIPTIFKGISWYLIEANYSDAILRTSGVDQAQKNRIITSHMSLEYCTKYLQECHAENAEGVVLVHLSDRHSNEEQFRQTITKSFGIPCYIADKGVEVNITKVI